MNVSNQSLSTVCCAMAGLFILGIPQSAKADRINGSFELQPFCPGTPCVSIVDASQVLGWQTTAMDNKIEIWANNFQSVSASGGNQHAELNANFVSTLYQIDSSIAAGSIVGFTFDHRGRAGVDTMRFTLTDLGADNLLGGLDDTVLFTQQYSDGNSGWVTHSGTGIAALGGKVQFSFASISAAGGNPAIGNFLDRAGFGVGVGADSPEPSAASLLLFGAGIILAVRLRYPRRKIG